jgi:hypothetical protein
MTNVIRPRNPLRYVTGALLFAWLVVACSDTGGEPGDGASEADCRAACEHARNVCGSGSDSVDACTIDCQTEPWSPDYIACRTRTCEGDTICEKWGKEPCVEACAHRHLECPIGSASGNVEDCVLDCQTEPWTANYIACRTETCETEGVCETWGM